MTGNIPESLKKDIKKETISFGARMDFKDTKDMRSAIDNIANRLNTNFAVVIRLLIRKGLKSYESQN